MVALTVQLNSELGLHVPHFHLGFHFSFHFLQCIKLQGLVANYVISVRFQDFTKINHAIVLMFKSVHWTMDKCLTSLHLIFLFINRDLLEEALWLYYLEMWPRDYLLFRLISPFQTVTKALVANSWLISHELEAWLKQDVKIKVHVKQLDWEIRDTGNILLHFIRLCSVAMKWFASYCISS